MSKKSRNKQGTPESSLPTLEDWKKLYDLAAQVKALAPWDWMDEDDIFGFKMPKTGDLGFVSVMGTLGEHLSVAVYQGIKGLNGFWKMQDLGPNLTPEFVLQVPQLQASFEDREIITNEDRSIMKTLGLKFRGAQAWPQFRSYRPGCLPWYLEQAEAEMLICGLEQTLEVAPRIKDEPDILFPTDSDDDYLLRVSENGVWKDSQVSVDLPAEQSIKLQMNLRALDALKQMLPGSAIIEVDCSMMSEPVQENRKERPFFPYMLMLAEHDSGFILGTDLLQPFPTIEEMWGEVPMRVVETLAKGIAPKEIQVPNTFMAGLLQPLESELGIKIKKVSRLTAINRARREFNRFMARF
jgi:hypothetical protein